MAKKYVVYRHVENGHEQISARIPSDVLGSYTGITEDGEKPVQDADDL